MRQIHFFSKRLSNCISRLNDIIEKLEQTDEMLSVVVDGQDGAQEVEQLITEDWAYISEMVDSWCELEDIQQTLQVQKSSQENVPLRYIKENKFNQVLQLTAQMQNILICQHQLQQLQLKLVELSDEGCYRGQDRGTNNIGTCLRTAQAMRTATTSKKVQAAGDYFNSCGDSRGRTDCENSKGFMDCHSFKISIGDEESFSCKNKNKDTDSKHCKDGEKGRIFQNQRGLQKQRRLQRF